MHFKLRDTRGNENLPTMSDDQIPYLVLNNERYEIITVDNRPEWVKAVDNDPEIQQIYLEALEDFENGRVYTKEEAIRMLDNGEIK